MKLDPSAAFRAFDEWASMQKVRGKSAEDVLRRLMRFWISFAIAKIEAGEAAKIRADLMKMRRG